MDSASTYSKETKEYEPRQARQQTHERGLEVERLEHFVKELNASFYRKVSKSFSESRVRPWGGWKQILEEIKSVFLAENDRTATDSLSVIDFGCGNGRLGVFLEEALPSSLHYVGIDNNTFLLEEARKKLPAQTFKHGDLTCSQDARSTQSASSFDISACFGVLHHLYGWEARTQLVVETITALRAPGLACISFWQPLNNARYRERSQHNIALLQHDNPHIPFELFGAQDLFLSWQEQREAIRYVHSFSGREIVEFLEAVISEYTDIKIRSIFKTDTGNDVNNTYAILQKG